MSQKTERADVVMAYRLLLGREPENDTVVDEMVKSFRHHDDLRKAFLDSAEFREIVARSSGNNGLSAVNADYFHTKQHIDVHVSAPVMQTLFDRTRQQWTLLGENDPFYSVLTDPGYRSDVISADGMAAFRASGEREANLIEIMAGRDNIEVPRGVCIELGCGVGRVTRFLANRFNKVIAVDISPGNIRLAQDYMIEEKVDNVEFVLVKGMEEFAKLPSADYLFSLIALQHNSPPLQYQILSALLSKIRPNGGCLFQTVSDASRYEFKVDEYLNSDHPEMEVHCLPMPEINSLLREKGFDLLAARLDPWTGFYGSYTFTAKRPSEKQRRWPFS